NECHGDIRQESGREPDSSVSWHVFSNIKPHSVASVGNANAGAESLTAQLRLLPKQIFQCPRPSQTGKSKSSRSDSNSGRAGVVLAWQILGPLLGEFALEHSRGLADLDQVAVGTSHVTANLGTAIDRRRHELGPF